MSLLLQKIKNKIDRFNTENVVSFSGRVSRFDGHMIECDGFPATIGTLCEIIDDNNGSIAAEIIGFRNNNNLLFVHKTGARISVGAKVKVVDEGYLIPVGDQLLWRVFDGIGNTLDNNNDLDLAEKCPLEGVKINPL